MSMSVTSETFAFARKYSDCLVETGTYHGAGLLGATYARFERMLTCELSPILQDIAVQNMGSQFGKITYYSGNSGDWLPEMLKAAGKRCVVLLDAHVVGGDSDCSNAITPGATVCPLREELAALAKADRHDHLILVDDIDLCGTHHLAGITYDEVIASLKQINGAYSFRIFDGIRPAMLLAAIPPK